MIALPIFLLSLLFAQASLGARATATASPAAAAGAAPAAQPTGQAPTALPSATPAAEGTPPVGSPLPAAPVTTPVTAAPNASPVPSATPSASAASPAAVPSVQASPQSPSGTPSPYKYRFVPHRPANVGPGQPVIVAVYLNSQRLRSEGPILIKVETNEAVVKVVSRSNGHEGGIPRLTAGDFEAASKLPKLPFIASGMTIDLEFIATSADGRKTSVRVPVKLN